MIFTPAVSFNIRFRLREIGGCVGNCSGQFESGKQRNIIARMLQLTFPLTCSPTVSIQRNDLRHEFTLAMEEDILSVCASFLCSTGRWGPAAASRKYQGIMGLENELDTSWLVYKDGP